MPTATPAVPTTIDEDEIDPLDAYMASLATEVTEQARSTSISPPTPPDSAIRQQHRLLSSPSPAMCAIVDKVSTSPFCDVLSAGGNASGKRRRAGAEDYPSGSLSGCAAISPPGSSGGDRPAAAAAAAACLTLLVNQPAEFLSRFGHILSPDDLDTLLPSQDPAVTLHIERLKSLMSSQEQRQNEQQRDQPLPPLSRMDEDDVDMPPATATTTTTTTTTTVSAGMAGTIGTGDGRAGGGRGKDSGARQGIATVRNRRYRRLQQLAEGGVWFSDEAMRERDPWLWFEHVGRRAGEEKPAPKQAVQEVPGSTSVGTYLQESLGFLSQQQPNGGWATDGVPASAGAGGPGRGAGSALGMAFLSGMCADAGGAQDVEAGEDVDCSDLPAASPSPTPTPGVPEFSSGVPASEGERRLPDGDADGDVMDTIGDATEVTAAVAAIGIRDDSANGDGQNEGAASGGGGREGEANGERRRVRFAQEEGEDDDNDGGDYDDDDDDDVMQEEEEEEETEGGRDEVARILSERFLSGQEEGVDYRSVDGDERLDDLEQLSRDEQDRWFHAEENDSAMD